MQENETVDSMKDITILFWLFVFNNCLAFICNASNYLGSRIDGLLPVGSTGCVLIGYLTLYTFTSFMFWINAMAANILQ